MKWGLKKNTRARDRQELLEKVNAGNLSEEGSVGTVSLNIEKVRRWRRELEERTVPADRISSQEIDGKLILRYVNSYVADLTNLFSR